MSFLAPSSKNDYERDGAHSLPRYDRDYEAEEKTQTQDVEKRTRNIWAVRALPAAGFVPIQEELEPARPISCPTLIRPRVVYPVPAQRPQTSPASIQRQQISPAAWSQPSSSPALPQNYVPRPSRAGKRRHDAEAAPTPSESPFSFDFSGRAGSAGGPLSLSSLGRASTEASHSSSSVAFQSIEEEEAFDLTPPDAMDTAAIP